MSYGRIWLPVITGGGLRLAEQTAAWVQPTDGLIAQGPGAVTPPRVGHCVYALRIIAQREELYNDDRRTGSVPLATRDQALEYEVGSSLGSFPMDHRPRSRGYGFRGSDGHIDAVMAQGIRRLTPAAMVRGSPRRPWIPMSSRGPAWRAAHRGPSALSMSASVHHLPRYPAGWEATASMLGSELRIVRGELAWRREHSLSSGWSTTDHSSRCWSVPGSSSCGGVRCSGSRVCPPTRRLRIVRG